MIGKKNSFAFFANSTKYYKKKKRYTAQTNKCKREKDTSTQEKIPIRPKKRDLRN